MTEKCRAKSRDRGVNNGWIRQKPIPSNYQTNLIKLLNFKYMKLYEQYVQAVEKLIFDSNEYHDISKYTYLEIEIKKSVSL